MSPSLYGVPIADRAAPLSTWPEYGNWASMKARCSNPKAVGYRHYGGRGITVCSEWRSSFMAFVNHIGPRPSPRHSVDRIDGAGHYEPGNVRWATPWLQARHATNGRKPDDKEPEVRLGLGAAALSAWFELTGTKKARFAAAVGASVHSVMAWAASPWTDAESMSRPVQTPSARYREAIERETRGEVPGRLFDEDAKRNGRSTVRDERWRQAKRRMADKAQSDALWEAACAATIGGC